MLLAECLQVGRADLFLSLEYDFYVATYEVESQGGAEPGYLYHGLPFVVVGSSPPNVSVADYGLEGFALPKLKRLHGHYIVVTVYKDGFCARVYNALGKNHGITGCGINFGSLHARGE